MKKYLPVLTVFTAAMILFSAALPHNIKFNEIFNYSEMEILKNGSILTFARIDGKGEVFNNRVFVPFNGIGGVFYINPFEFTVAAAEKCFIKKGEEWGEKAFNALYAFDKLNGMKYYSRSESGIRTLITGSWISATPSWIRDRDSSHVVSHFVIKDNRLGEIPFNNDLAWGGDVIVSSSISSTQISRFGLKIFEPGDYRIYKVLVYDRKSGGWYYYSAQFMRVRSDILKTLDLLLPENICNRVRADTVHFLGMTGIDRSAELAAFR